MEMITRDIFLRAYQMDMEWYNPTVVELTLGTLKTEECMVRGSNSPAMVKLFSKGTGPMAYLLLGSKYFLHPSLHFR